MEGRSHPFSAAAQRYRYVIGIDLGTTNTAVAYVDLARKPGKAARRAIASFEVPQVVGPGAFATQPVLPSFCYLPGAYDLPAGSTALPWDADRAYVVGAFAREQGARVPGRLVASAKSWLCHAGVDRTAPILPWGAPDEVPKVSPVAATTRYLQHLREAWNAQQAATDAGHAFEDQLLILTVPASFDEVARELTVAAAREAGLPHVVLLEEPLAAFYAWLSDHAAAWKKQINEGHLILVCDVGGGTTDFSVVGLRRGEDGLGFDRLAVGDHLMLGGDNMDYALGRHLEAQLAGGPGRLDVQRWHQLVHACRQAKERLLGDEDEADAVDVTVLGAAGKLIGGTLKGSLTRQDVRRLVLDGFFPDAELETPLAEGRREGLTELGLPYAQDPAITRHLAAFWRRSLPYVEQATGRAEAYPDFLLFNGGVFTPAALRARVQEVVRGWFEPVAGAGWAPVALSNPRLDAAVATGAAYYGLVRLGEGVRVGSGSPRAYYVGVAAGQADAAEAVHPAVCLVPRGAEEGFVGRLDALDFEALTNRPVTFQLYTSTARSDDAPGDVAALPAGEVSVLPPIRTVLQFGKKAGARKIPVQLAVRLNEIGTLELWCQSTQTDHRWQLEFDVRRAPEPAAAPPAEETIEPERIDAAQDLLRQAVEQPEPPKLERLWNDLEGALGMGRDAWPVPVIRKLADTLLDAPRRRTPGHEALWFEFLGFCLRPGFGDPVDEWRMKQAWKHYLEGLRFPDRLESRIAWWTFWRRVAGGLPADKQAQVYYEVRPFLQLKVKTKKQHRIYPRRMETEEKLMAWRALASFERLPADLKVTLGRLLLQKFKEARPKSAELWAISRLGARHPVYGPLDCVVPSDEVTAWLKTLLTRYLPRRPSVAYALVHLARYTGDRNRDVSEETRRQVARWLRKMPDEDHYKTLLTHPDSDFSHEGRAWLLGEALPEDAEALEEPHGIAFTTDEDAAGERTI